MKAAACLVFVALLFQGEALRCNFCFSSDANLCRPTSIQTCSGSSNACGAVILTGPLNRSFRQCMDMVVCQGFITTPGAFAQCCSTNLCN